MNEPITINDVTFTTEEFFNCLVHLVNSAMDNASARGAYSEVGLVYHFAKNSGWID